MKSAKLTKQRPLQSQKIVEVMRSMTNGKGADASVDAVGMEVERGFREKIADFLSLQAGSVKIIA
jgi:threonine dehydrogenase-like Zn-dependent dehydrogenase